MRVVEYAAADIFSVSPKPGASPGSPHLFAERQFSGAPQGAEQVSAQAEDFYMLKLFMVVGGEPEKHP